MKRMIGFFIMIILLMLVGFTKEDNFSAFYSFSKMTLVTTEKLDSKAEPIISGNQYYYTFENTNENIKLLEDNSFDCYIFYFDLELNANKLMENFDYIYQGGSAQDYLIYYGYCSNFKDYRYVDGKKINFQLAKTGEGWILGLPLIETGF